MVSIQELPDEIILKVINYLQIKDLMRCGQASKRIREISRDKSLWQKLNFCNLGGKQVLPTELVKMVLENGCQYLRLESAVLGCSLGLRSVSEGKMGLNKISKLRYLDLTNCTASKDCLEEILASCIYLQKFSIASFYIFNPYRSLSQNMIESICYQNGRTLQTLNLSSCHGLDLDSIKKITVNCKNLKNVDLSCTFLSGDSVKFLVNNLNPKAEKLNLAHLSNITDDLIKTLITRCNRLSWLILACTSITKKSWTHISENLQNTLEKLDISWCINVTYAELTVMKSMPSLKVLHCQDYICNLDKELFKKKMPALKFNEKFSVDERRPFIWENKGEIWDIKAELQMNFFK